MQCVVKSCPNAALEDHHLWPTALNGPVDGPTVPLCSNCHRLIHLYAGKLFRGEALAENNQQWLTDAAPLIQRIVRAMREAEGENIGNAPARIILHINKEELRRIHRQKQDRGFSSLEKYILALIRADLPPQLR